MRALIHFPTTSPKALRAPQRTLRKLSVKSRRMLRATAAVAAVEFALVFPVLAILFLGTVEITQAVVATRRVGNLSRTLADLASQQNAGFNTATSTGATITMDALFNAARSVLNPLDPSAVKMRVSSISLSPANKTCVDWSEANANWTALAVNSSPALPRGLSNPLAAGSQQFIMAEVEYPYSPIFGFFITGTVAMTGDPAVMLPRQSGKISNSDSGVAQANPPCS